jgi:hypothetical protein
MIPVDRQIDCNPVTDQTRPGDAFPGGSEWSHIQLLSTNSGIPGIYLVHSWHMNDVIC